MAIFWLFKVLIFLIFNNTSYANSNNYAIPEKDYDNRDYFLLEMKESSFLSSIQKTHPDWKYEYQIPSLDKFHLFSLPKNHTDLDIFQNVPSLDNFENSVDGGLLKREYSEFVDTLQLNNVNGIHTLPKKRIYHRAPVPIEIDSNGSLFKRKQDSTVEELNKIANEFEINDPLFDKQWHIVNTAFPGHDVNVVPVWRMNITGKGVITALIDDGLDYDSLDLKDSYCAEGSWDYNDNRRNPKPMLSNDYHGTRCAAEIAAKKGNGYCGVGVAYDSKVSGIRILSAEISAEEEAAAMMYALDINDIYSCSWGPPDNGRSMDVPDKIVRAAMLKGIQDGRDGKGALYVFASGNGAAHGDNCNFDGYTNSIYSLTVSAIDHKGLHPQYSESCTAVMVSTYSSGSGEYIHTADINDKCADTHGGTSAAAPLAAGIYALILEANPDLTWRDVQYLTVLSAAEIDRFDSLWQDTAIEGRRYSPKYGWGKIDAEKMVSMAKDNWELLKPQSWYYMPYQTTTLEILNEVTEVQDSFTITPEVLKKSNFDHIEQITITVDISSDIRGHVEIDLISPNGIVSALAVERPRDTDKFGFRKWTFSTVAHWGEQAQGTWKLKVRNTSTDNSLNFKGWQLRAFGECIDPTLAKRFDMDEDYSEVNFENDNDETTDTVTGTTNPDIASPSTDILNTVTDTHNDSDNQITKVTEETSTETSFTFPTTTVSEVPSSSTTSGSNSDYDSDNGSYKNTSTSTHYVAYFSGFIIAGFALILYILKTRRKPGRARRREDFEFDIIRPEDDESSRFEFDDSDYDEVDHENHNDNRNNFDLGVFDDDANSIDMKNKTFGNDTRLTDSKEDYGFDLGNSNLSGYDKTDAIIKDAKTKQYEVDADVEHLNESSGLVSKMESDSNANTVEDDHDEKAQLIQP